MSNEQPPLVLTPTVQEQLTDSHATLHHACGELIRKGIHPDAIATVLVTIAHSMLSMKYNKALGETALRKFTSDDLIKITLEVIAAKAKADSEKRQEGKPS